MIEPTRQEILTRLARLSRAGPGHALRSLIANLTFMAAGPWDQTLWDLEDELLVGAIPPMESDLSRRADEAGGIHDKVTSADRFGCRPAPQKNSPTAPPSRSRSSASS